MRIFCTAFATLLVMLCVPATSAAPNTPVSKIESEAMQETRKILVRPPNDYDPEDSKHYPVLFTLNDSDNFEWASYIVNIQASRHGIEDMFVVGLPHAGNYSGDNYPFEKKGSRDLNPQAQRYSDFIRNEAIPFIEETYRVNGGRFIVGHSLSALFVGQMWMQHPDQFSTYIMLSPSMQHAPQMADAMKSFLLGSQGTSSQLYLSLGDLEHEQIRHGYKRLTDVFEQAAPDGLNWHATNMADTDHLLSAFKGTYDALAWMYRNYTIRTDDLRTMSVTQIVENYRQLSKQLGYEIRPRKRVVTGASYFLANRVGDLKAAEKFLEAGSILYPDAIDIKKQLEDLRCNAAEGSGISPSADTECKKDTGAD